MGKICLLLLLFLLLPFGQLEKMPLGISGVSVYFHDLVLTGIWIVLLLNYPIFKFFKDDKLIRKFLIFTGIAFLSWLINLPKWGSKSLIGLMYLLRWAIFFGTYLLVKLEIKNQKCKINSIRQLADKILNSKNKRNLLLNSSIFELLKSAIFIAAVFGVFQYLFFPDLRYLKYFGWDDHYYRMTGTFLDPNFFGALMVIGLGLEIMGKSEIQNSICQPADETNSKFRIPISKQVSKLKEAICSFSKILFYLVCLTLTYSRASWLAWLILLSGWTIDRIFITPVKKDLFYILRVLLRPAKLLVAAFWLMITLLFFYFIPRPAGEGGNLLRTASVVARERNWSGSWQVIKRFPVFGVGFNNYQLASPGNAKADNSLLLIWATTGIFGLAAFFWLMIGLKPWWLTLPLIFHSLFNNTLFYSVVLILVWGLQAVKYEADG